jgi:hypothetical protein
MITSNGVTLQRSNSLTSLTSTMTTDDSIINQADTNNQDSYLRICVSCQKVLQHRYNHISFQTMEKDDIFVHYEVIYHVHV